MSASFEYSIMFCLDVELVSFICLCTNVKAPEFVPYLFLQKIFLDTTRLLAEHTDNLIDELWNYIEGGSIVQSAVLLLATQKQIRRCLSCNGNGKSKLDGFHVIINRIRNHIVSLESDQTGKENMGVEKSRATTALLLVHAVSQAG
jgi:hypothetical protein